MMRFGISLYLYLLIFALGCKPQATDTSELNFSEEALSVLASLRLNAEQEKTICGQNQLIVLLLNGERMERSDLREAQQQAQGNPRLLSLVDPTKEEQEGLNWHKNFTDSLIKAKNDLRERIRHNPCFQLASVASTTSKQTLVVIEDYHGVGDSKITLTSYTFNTQSQTPIAKIEDKPYSFINGRLEEGHRNFELNLAQQTTDIFKAIVQLDKFTQISYYIKGHGASAGQPQNRANMILFDTNGSDGQPSMSPLYYSLWTYEGLREICERTQDNNPERIQFCKDHHPFAKDGILTPKKALMQGINQPGSGINQPGSGINQPGSGINQPGSGINQPGSGINQPGSGINQPGSGINQPGSGINQPGSGPGNNPGTGINQPGSGAGNNPGTGINQPGSGATISEAILVNFNRPNQFSAEPNHRIPQGVIQFGHAATYNEKLAASTPGLHLLKFPTSKETENVLVFLDSCAQDQNATQRDIPNVVENFDGSESKAVLSIQGSQDTIYYWSVDYSKFSMFHYRLFPNVLAWGSQGVNFPEVLRQNMNQARHKLISALVNGLDISRPTTEASRVATSNIQRFSYDKYESQAVLTKDFSRMFTTESMYCRKPSPPYRAECSK